MTGVIRSIGFTTCQALIDLGNFFRLGVQTLFVALTPPFDIKAIGRELYNFGNKSIPVVLLIALFTGLVLAVQTMYGLERFGSQMYVGQVVALSMVRELGPVLTAVMVAARMGSGIAAEIGSMQVTEQIDAMRALGANPIRKLVVPKTVAATIALPLLTVSANFVGILGAIFIATLQLHMSSQFFVSQVEQAIYLSDYLTGLAKTIFFAWVIAIVGCHQGFQAKGGTVGVGRVTTESVVKSCVLILMLDFVLTKMLLLIQTASY